MPDDRLVEAHGSVNSATCVKCKINFKYAYIKGKIIQFYQIYYHKDLTGKFCRTNTQG